MARQYDSLGWLTKLVEPGVAPQSRTFDSWGNVTQVQWCDDLTPAPCPSADRRNIARYDARNRLTHREDQAAGQTVPSTVYDYHYDYDYNNNGGARALGRLHNASWPTGEVAFGYDAFGRNITRSFYDTGVTPTGQYYQDLEFHDDGSERSLHLWLSDTGFAHELVNFGYDSAGRVNSVVYNDGASSQTLFSASGTNPIYDAVSGRITAAQYGVTLFNQSFAATGRRLLTDMKVTGVGSAVAGRDIAFPTIGGVNPYDPVGASGNVRKLLLSPQRPFKARHSIVPMTRWDNWATARPDGTTQLHLRSTRQCSYARTIRVARAACR